jgi:TRAP-type C4-dicarboxylate transport system substrate-binding protein
MKFFAWAGESEQQDIMKSLGYTPVPLETSDILPSIQTGMITAVPATPTSRWPARMYATAGHMLDINWAHRRRAGGHQKSWDEMSPAARDALKAAGTRAGLQMRTQARKEVDEAVDAMKKRGLQVHTEPRADEGMEHPRRAALPRIRGDGARRNLRRGDEAAQGLPRRQALNRMATQPKSDDSPCQGGPGGQVQPDLTMHSWLH